MIVWPLCVIASKPTWGVVLCVYCFCPVRVIPLPLPVSSLPLLCSLSEDWGEPVSSCDEGLLRDAAAVNGPGGQGCTEVTGCWRGSVAKEICIIVYTLYLFFQVLMIRFTQVYGDLVVWVQCIHAFKVKGFLWSANHMESQKPILFVNPGTIIPTNANKTAHKL